MFLVVDKETGQTDFSLKPMNCPFHILIYKDRLRSYRELPVRLGELGTVYRYERSGVMHGLLRVRGFTQDDAHIFCMESQILSETEKFCALLQEVYRDLGFEEVAVKLSTRPEKRAGTDKTWDKAETSLAEAVRAAGLSYELQPGEGAFYGPKLEFQLKDCIGRTWQCGTLQLDFVLPERLDATYIGEDGAKHRPVMLHRAILGSLERFIGILIENYSGKFPFWLAPEQARVLTISEKYVEYGKSVEQQLRDAGFRVTGDYRPEKIQGKIRDGSLEKMPYLLIVGEKEQAAGNVALRDESVQPPLALTVHRIKAEARGLRCTSGGRFHHLTGAGDKGLACRHLINFYRRRHSGIVSIAIGDSLNDLPMLASADRPILVQYAVWLGNVVRGDFGYSYTQRRPVTDILAERFPRSMELAVMTIIIATLWAVPLGVVSAVRQNTWIDHAVRVVSISGLSLPIFFTGVLVLYLLVRLFRWMPPLEYVALTEEPLENFKQLIWPALVQAYYISAPITRLTRSQMLEVIRQDYITTARAKGLSDRMVIWKHTLRNAMITIITILGLQLVLLGIYAKTYALVHDAGPVDLWIRRFHLHYTLERGVTLGGALFAAQKDDRSGKGGKATFEIYKDRAGEFRGGIGIRWKAATPASKRSRAGCATGRACGTATGPSGRRSTRAHAASMLARSPAM